MEDCCRVDAMATEAPKHCPRCQRPGRAVDRITLKALLRPSALMRLAAPSHRFCATSDCPVVYFGHDETFERQDLTVPVFQKEPMGDRLVCYCFGVTEGEIHREVLEAGASTAEGRIRALVKAERCACEVKNPQGACCLGNITAVARAAKLSLAPPAGSK